MPSLVVIFDPNCRSPSALTGCGPISVRNQTAQQSISRPGVSRLSERLNLGTGQRSWPIRDTLVPVTTDRNASVFDRFRTYPFGWCLVGAAWVSPTTWEIQHLIMSSCSDGNRGTPDLARVDRLSSHSRAAWTGRFGGVDTDAVSDTPILFTYSLPR